MSTLWTYSPVPAVEEAVQRIRQKYPATYPAGLERIHECLAKLGNPHHQLPFTFHVAGTNGKGSTLAFLQAIFEANGVSVHKFISPHLIRFEERIVLNGKMIAPSLLLELIDEIDRVADGNYVSFFEFFTVLAFLAYARHPAEVLLLETGLGGTFDATNVISGDKIISLLTRISFDHTHILGHTLAEIAGNKAGIIKKNCACVIGPQMSDDVMKVFTQRAKELNAPVYAHGSDWRVTPTDNGFDYASTQHRFHLPQPQLMGRHQFDNAGTAIAAVEKSPYTHLLTQDKLAQAMRDVTWPGRMQKITSGGLAKLLPEGWELWVDGAHNDSGAEVLTDQIKTWGPRLPLHMIVAMKDSKNAAAIYELLLPHAASIQAVDVSWIEAPMTSAERLYAQVRAMGYDRMSITPDLESAIRALAFKFDAPQRILITGSLYLVGHALKE